MHCQKVYALLKYLIQSSIWLISHCRKFNHISPVLRELGWSSIKHLLLVCDVTQLYKIVNGLEPSYLNCQFSKRTGIHSYNLYQIQGNSRRSYVQDSHCTTFLSLSIYQHLELAIKVQAQEIVKHSLALRGVPNWSYVTLRTR